VAHQAPITWSSGVHLDSNRIVFKRSMNGFKQFFLVHRFLDLGDAELSIFCANFIEKLSQIVASGGSCPRKHGE
jgi:hypothetical protein